MAKKIMIVEDSQEMQAIYHSMFKGKEAAYEVEMFTDATQALAKARAGAAYDLVILDIIMEPMTGDSFFVRLRMDEKFLKVPVIIASVLPASIMKNLQTTDNVAVLQKPLTKEALFAEIKRLLGEQNG